MAPSVCIAAEFCFCSNLSVRWECTRQPFLKIDTLKKCFVHSPRDSEWLHAKSSTSLLYISEEVCWLQQEQDLSANNSDDRSTADLCSWKTILMIQLSVAEFNCIPLFFDTFRFIVWCWLRYPPNIINKPKAIVWTQHYWVLCCPVELNFYHKSNLKEKLRRQKPIVKH